MHSLVLLSTMHVQVYTLDRCCEYQRTHLLHPRYKRDVHMRYVYTCVYAYVYVYIYGYACIYVYMYVCVYVYMHIYVDVYMCVYVCICVYIYMYVCICMCIYICIWLYIACMCSLFHLALGYEDGEFQLVYESACLLAWGVIFDRRKKRGVVCVFSIFNAGGSVCGCVCVCSHTHTHTAQMGYSDVSPGVGMRHLEGPRNPDGLNLGIHVFVYVYKVHMCIYAKRRDEILD